MGRRIKKFDSEENLHQNIVDYVKYNYPSAPLRTDFAAGIKLTPGQAIKHSRLQTSRAWPDIFIAVPMYKDDKSINFCGLFIELKKNGTKLVREKDCSKILKGEFELRKKGDWWNQHIEEQAEVMSYLRLNGYCATFAVGFDAAKYVIDKYLATHKARLEDMDKLAMVEEGF